MFGRQLRFHDLNVATSVEVVDHTDVKCYTFFGVTGFSFAWHRFVAMVFTEVLCWKRYVHCGGLQNLFLEFVWYEVDFEHTYN